MGIGEAYTDYWWGTLRPPERPRRRWEDNIILDFQDVEWGTITGLIWLRIGTGGGHL